MEVKVIMHLNGDEGLVQFFFQFSQEINEILKAKGCKFDSRSRMWEIEIKPENGRPEDKITEIALALMAQGHEVEVEENDIPVMIKTRKFFIDKMIENGKYNKNSMVAVHKDGKLTILNPTEEFKTQLDELIPVIGVKKSFYKQGDGNYIVLKNMAYTKREIATLIKTLPLSHKVMEELTIKRNGEEDWEYKR